MYQPFQEPKHDVVNFIVYSFTIGIDQFSGDLRCSKF